MTIPSTELLTLCIDASSKATNLTEFWENNNFIMHMKVWACLQLSNLVHGGFFDCVEVVVKYIDEDDTSFTVLKFNFEVVNLCLHLVIYIISLLKELIKSVGPFKILKFDAKHMIVSLCHKMIF